MAKLFRRIREATSMAHTVPLDAQRDHLGKNAGSLHVVTQTDYPSPCPWAIYQINISYSCASK